MGLGAPCGVSGSTSRSRLGLDSEGFNAMIAAEGQDTYRFAAHEQPTPHPHHDLVERKQHHTEDESEQHSTPTGRRQLQYSPRALAQYPSTQSTLLRKEVI